MEKRKEMGVTLEALRLREVALNSHFAKVNVPLRVKAVEVDKNNMRKAGWQLTRKELRAALTFYPTVDMLALTDGDIANELAEIFRMNEGEMAELAKEGVDPIQRDELMGNVIIELMSAANCEWLERSDRTFKRVMDMAACLKCPIRMTDNEMASVQVTNGLLERLGLRADEVFKRAVENLEAEARIRPMRQIASKLIDLEPDDCFAEKMFIVTNGNSTYGAGLMLSKKVQSELLDIFNRKSVVILPSSVHEFIAIPGDFMPIDEARAMVREINAMVVAPEDRLTDEAYLLTGTPEHPILAMYADLGLPERSLIVAK